MASSLLLAACHKPANPCNPYFAAVTVPQDAEETEFPDVQRAVAQALAAAESSMAALRALEPLAARLAAVQSSELPTAHARATRLEAALAKQTEHSEGLEQQAADLELALQV